MNKVIEIQLSEIRDIGWPVDETLVQSFRSTLQSGSAIPIILVNICYSEDGWYYEVIDGLHRLAAKQLEGATSILAQVVEVDDRTARLQRIQACLSKPADVVIGRAKVELRRLFRDDILQQIGAITIVYEPVLTEEGKPSKRVRQQSLPEDPIELLFVFSQHKRLLENDADDTNNELRARYIEVNGYYRDNDDSPFEKSAPVFVGWENIIRNWAASVTSIFPGGKEVIAAIIKDGERKMYGHDRVLTNMYLVPDVDIRRILVRHDEHHNATIDGLATNLNWHRGHETCPWRHIPRSEQIRLFTSSSPAQVLRDLEVDWRNHEQEERQQERDERDKQKAIREDEDNVRMEVQRVTWQAQQDLEAASTVVFAAASSQFLAPSPQLIEAAIPSEVPVSPELTLQGLVQRLCREHGYVLFAYNNGTTIDMVAGDIHRSPQLLQEITDHVKQATQGDQING